MISSRQVTTNNNNIFIPDITITTTITSISKITNTTNNLILSKLTLGFHITKPQLKLPQVPTLMNPPINNKNTNKIPHTIPGSIS